MREKQIARFLVPENVEGETLQARLSKSAIPLDALLEICRKMIKRLYSKNWFGGFAVQKTFNNYNE